MDNTLQSNLKVMMVCTEFPPMHGGVGRYTYNLVKSLRLYNIKVVVVSDAHGLGDYKGISPYSKKNSEVLLSLVKKINPDIIHVQHEHGLYGFYLHSLNPSKTSTGLDRFYNECNIPIVTTFHTSMNFIQWMKLVNTKEKNHRKGISLHVHTLHKYWRQLVNYSSLHRINKQIMSKSAYGIVFSNYLKKLIPGTNVIYHGSEPYFEAVDKLAKADEIKNEQITQAKARKKLFLPLQGKLALANGFLTATKGWDIIKKMKMPAGWRIVVNHSRNFYNKEKGHSELGIHESNDDNSQIIYLNKNYLSEPELSLLFIACDAVFLPYKVSSGSGVMFDGLGHGKPFVASDLDFFREFSSMNLGITSKRNPKAFEEAFVTLDKNYGKLETSIKDFRKVIKWDNVALQHIMIYNTIVKEPQIKQTSMISKPN